MRYLGTIGIVFVLSTGIAAAGPHGGGGAVVRDHRSASGGAIVRDHRGPAGGGAIVRDHRGPAGGGTIVRDHRGPGGGGAIVRDHRGPGGRAIVREHRGPVRISRGRYVFPGGVVRTYRAPVIRTHYYSYYRRPALLVETVEPVPGYVWLRGSWRWNGVEWLWVPGYWAVATAPVGVSVGASVVVD